MDAIEKQNNININVFCYDESIYPIRISKRKYEKHMELLYITDEKNKSHYVFIKDFSRLMYGFNNYFGKKHFRTHCLQYFYSENDFKNHKNDCIVYNRVQQQ